MRTLTVRLEFLLLPDCPSPYFGLLVYWFLWLLFSTRVTYLRDGVTPAGRGLLVLDRNEGLVSPFGSGTLVGSWLAVPPLSAGICAPCQGVWPGGPQCVLTVGLPLALSRVLHGPLLGVWGVFRLGLGLVPQSVAQLCALFPGVPLSPLCTPGRRSASRFT